MNNSTASRWFEEECGVDHDDTPDDYEESESDLYNEYLASELLDDDGPADHSTDPVETPHVSTSVDNTEGLGTIFPPYRDIINECLLSVFNIDKPKDWQILLIQALVFSDKASNRRVMCIRQTGDGKASL